MRNALSAVLLLVSLSAHASEKLNGFNMPCWWKDCYAQPGTRESLKRMAQTGAGWVALTPTWYMGGYGESAMKMEDGTPDDDSLRSAIRAAKGDGLKVAIKPHVDVHGARMRALIHPHDAKAWFTAYRAMMTHYARMAADERADMLVVGTELAVMDGPMHRGEWLKVIAECRAAYSGPMTYASNWYDFARVSFWDKLDYIGIDGYFPIMNGHHKRLMKLEWLAYEPAVAAASALHGKPVLFTEFGLSSQKGANLKPWEWKDFGPLDLEVQKNYFESFLEVFGTKSWFAGIWQWGWEINPDAGGPKDKSMTVQGKPALESLKAYFAKTSAAPKGMSVQQKGALNESVSRALDAVSAAPGFRP